MLRRVIIGTLAVVAVLVIGATSWVAWMDRQLDSDRLVDRLDAMAVPEELELVDEWALDGSWFIKQRLAEARRKYVGPGTVDEACAGVAAFYTAAGVEVAGIGTLDDLCGHVLFFDNGTVRVHVELIREWTDVPSRYTGQRELVEVTFFATSGG